MAQVIDLCKCAQRLVQKRLVCLYTHTRSCLLFGVVVSRETVGRTIQRTCSVLIQRRRRRTRLLMIETLSRIVSPTQLQDERISTVEVTHTSLERHTEPQESEVCLKDVIKWLVPTRIPPPLLELGLNPLGPAFRVQSTSSGAAADATGPRPRRRGRSGRSRT